MEMPHNLDANADSLIERPAFRHPLRPIVGGESDIAAGRDSPRGAAIEHDPAAARYGHMPPFETGDGAVFSAVFSRFVHAFEEAAT